MAQSNTRTIYEGLKSEVCIPHTSDSRYTALKHTLMNAGDALAKIEVKRIVDITKNFATALGSERKIKYCGNEDCKTLPHIKNFDSKDNELLTRSFIPTAYHILQDYDLMYLKSEILLKELDSRRKLENVQWRRTTFNKINQIGLNKNAQYYQDCIDTINQVISLREYDMAMCIKTPNKKMKKEYKKFLEMREKHKAFLVVLEELKTLIQNLKSKRHPPPPRGTPPPPPRGTSSPQARGICMGDVIEKARQKAREEAERRRKESENTGKSTKNPKPKPSETAKPAPTGFRLLKDKDNEEDFFGGKK